MARRAPDPIQHGSSISLVTVGSIVVHRALNTLALSLGSQTFSTFTSFFGNPGSSLLLAIVIVVQLLNRV